MVPDFHYWTGVTRSGSRSASIGISVAPGYISMFGQWYEVITDDSLFPEILDWSSYSQPRVEPSRIPTVVRAFPRNHYDTTTTIRDYQCDMNFGREDKSMSNFKPNFSQL